jgi:hypothetical protein
MLETRLMSSEDGEFWKHGYFLSIEELVKLARNFLDNCDGFVDNDKTYIESWLKKNT